MDFYFSKEEMQEGVGMCEIGFDPFIQKSE